MVRFVVKMAGDFRDKIVMSGWNSLKSLLLKVIIYFSGKVKLVAIKFIKINHSIHFNGSITRTLKECFIKLMGLFSVTGNITVGAIKFVTHIPADITVTGAVMIWTYKILSSLMESKITIIADMAVDLHLLFFPKASIGVGFNIQDNILTSQKFAKINGGKAINGIAKVKSNVLPFYIKNLDPIKLKDMDIYMLKELDGYM